MALTLVFNDTFTEASDTLLTSHTPDTGTGWTALTNSPASNATVYSTGVLGQPWYAGGQKSYYKINVTESQTDLQAAEAVIHDAARCRPAVQLQDGASGVNGYIGWINTSTNRVVISRVDEGVYTDLNMSDIYVFVTNDVLKLTIDASGNLDALVNGSSKVTATDTTYTGGMPGLSTAASATDVGDDFNAWLDVTSGSSATIVATQFAQTATASGTVTDPAGTIATTQTVQTAAASASYTPPPDPSITTAPLKNNTGTVLSGQTVTASVYDISTGALVVRKTGLTSDGSGVVTFSDAAMAAATQYQVVLTIGADDGITRVTTA